LATTVKIQEDLEIDTMLYDYMVEPLRLVVVGNIAGDTYIQEFYSNSYGIISGEALINVSENFLSVVSVEFVISPLDSTTYITQYFENTGNITVSSFTAFKLEVYR
jgi:hypothetical protein